MEYLSIVINAPCAVTKRHPLQIIKVFNPLEVNDILEHVFPLKIIGVIIVPEVPRVPVGT